MTEQQITERLEVLTALLDTVGYSKGNDFRDKILKQIEKYL